jgi:hypothetical protein
MLLLGCHTPININGREMLLTSIRQSNATLSHSPSLPKVTPTCQAGMLPSGCLTGIDINDWGMSLTSIRQ